MSTGPGRVFMSEQLHLFCLMPKFPGMTVAISQWIWERKGCPVTSQWAVKHHNVWSCSELRGPCAPPKWPPPLLTSCGMHYRSEWDSISCPHCSWPNTHGTDYSLLPTQKENTGLVCSSTLPRQIETSPSTSATSGLCERTGCTLLPELQFGLWSHAAEYFVLTCPLIKMDLHRGLRSSTL